MADYEEVLPRITDPAMKPLKNSNGDLQNKSEGGNSLMNTARGLFTSMYENKIIVAAIVIFIVIVLILAYFVFRKSDNKKPKQELMEEPGKSPSGANADSKSLEGTPQTKPAVSAANAAKVAKKPVDLAKLYKAIDTAKKEPLINNKSDNEQPNSDKSNTEKPKDETDDGDLTKFLRGDESDEDISSDKKENA